MNHPKPTPEQFTHNGVLMQPHYDNAVRAWEKMDRMDVEKAAEYAFLSGRNKPFFIDTFRDLLYSYDREEISLSKVVEELNIRAFEWAKQQEGEGLRWVKAIERLPIGKVVARDGKNVGTLEIFTEGAIFISHMRCDTFRFNDDPLYVFEWLEEPNT